MSSDRRSAKGLIGVGFALLASLYAIDFHLDVRERDAFSWMDPYQYYEFAVEVLDGGARFNSFEIPSLFPFFVLPFVAIDASVPAALWTNFAFALLLLWSIHRLCEELAIATPSPLVALLVLSSPLLIGLSRTLYVEYALCALTAATFLYWCRFVARGDVGSGLRFGALFGLGFMTKMTFPLFLMLPIAASVLVRLATRRNRAAVAMIAAAAVPIAVALSIQTTVFSASFAYYLSLGNTALPIMYLIGPTSPASWASVGFYPAVVGRSMLGLLTPFLALAAWLSWRGSRRFRWDVLDGPRAALWLWLVGPLVFLIAQPVKEPRHVAPAVVAAVLLLVMGIESVRARGVRSGLLAAALLLGALQFAAITAGAVEVPYFLDRSLHLAELRAQMLRADPDAASLDASTPDGLLPWKFDQNLVIAGFPANEALALTWNTFPGVAFDLATLEDPDRVDDAIPFDRFEDLYIFTALNTYNRRCGWHRYYGTLPVDEVVRNADFVLVRGMEPDEQRRRFPEHLSVASVERSDGPVSVLRAAQPTVPYRSLYARRFLARHPSLSQQELRLVAVELLMAAVLRGDDGSVESLTAEFPILRDRGSPHRNLYWIGGYGHVIEHADRLIRRQSEGVGARRARD